MRDTSWRGGESGHRLVIIMSFMLQRSVTGYKQNAGLRVIDMMG